jgi:8-oxo-dGTP pyrophosphatase MutT (NUDIX family)/GNAT superfamily N-acetyltransferase
VAITAAKPNEVMTRQDRDIGSEPFGPVPEEDEQTDMGKYSAKEVTHAGLALLAKDTGRVLTLQRALSEKDPAGGKLEFPGGGIEEGESPLEGAIREWKEETGSQLPPGQVTHDWLSNGMYRGFVYVIPEEKALEINGSPDDRQVLNPDDPDSDNIEVVLWMDPKDLKANPAVRKEVRTGTDWSVFGKARRKAAAVAAPKPACECGHDQSEHSRNRGTCDSCWRHFMDHFQDYYQGIGPEVTYCKRYKGDRVKTAAQASFEDGDGNDIEDLEGHRPALNKDGTIPLYHATSEQNAKNITQTGKWRSDEGDDVFFSTKPASDYIKGFGDHVVKAHIPPHLLHINDAFRDGEIHFSVNRHHLRPEHVQGYGRLGKYSSVHEAKPYAGNHTFVFHQANPRSMGGVNWHTLEAWDSDDPQAHIRPEDRQPSRDKPEPVGWVNWSHKSGEIRNIQVRPEAQRQGLGTELLDRARTIAQNTRGVTPPRHSSERTISGDAWAKSLKERLPRRQAADRDDYGMEHSPNDDGPPLHNLTEEGNYTPSDFYENMHQYGTGADQADAESMSAIWNARGNRPLHKRPAVDNSKWREKGIDLEDHPEETEENFAKRQEDRRNGEHHVTVYRAAPKGVKSLNHGDWVSLSPTYARDEGRVSEDKSEDYPVYKARVKAKHVRWPADSINEFGYFGPEAKTETHYRGGRNAKRVEPQAREGAMRVRLANEEITVPRNIDTLRDSTCAVCGSVDSMNGDRCTVCGYMATPQAFQSPDTSLAPKVRDELGIGNPDSDQFGGAPDSGLEGPPGAEDDLDAMNTSEDGLGGPEGAEGPPGGPDLICDNCGSEFDSQGEEEDLSEPYLSPASRIEPDVSALGVEDDMEVARQEGQEENMEGADEGVAYQAGDECPVCGEGNLVPFEGDDGQDEGLPGQEGDEEGPLDEEGPPGAEDELGPPGEEEPEEEGPPGDEEGPDDQEEAPPGEEEVVPPDDDDEDTDEDGDDEDDQEEDDEGPPFRRQRKGSSTMAVTPGAARPARNPVPAERQAPRRQAAAPNPAAAERKKLFQALAATTEALNRQADRLQAQDRMLGQIGRFVRQASTKMSELGLRNETLERQMALVANASGLMEPLATIGAAGQARVATLYRQANPANPAQPVPEPPSEPPVATSQDAVQAQGRDDVTQLGATPVDNVAAAATTAVDLPYGELANEPVGMTRTDVTAPVQGTETATPPEMTVIPVDARIGNPDNPQPAFPFTIGPVGAPSRPYSGPSVGNPPSTAARNGQRPEPGVAVHPQAQAQAHYIASVNLARLRAQVGISNEEPFQLGTKIAAAMSDAQINAEAQGLQAVASRVQAQPQAQYFAPGPAFEPVMTTGIPDARPMVPHMASVPGGSVLPADPSFQAGKYGPGPGATIQGTTMFAPRADEFGWDSPV